MDARLDQAYQVLISSFLPFRYLILTDATVLLKLDVIIDNSKLRSLACFPFQPQVPSLRPLRCNANTLTGHAGDTTKQKAMYLKVIYSRRREALLFFATFKTRRRPSMRAGRLYLL